MLEMLQASLFTSAETAINALLQRDPVSLQHLGRLDGKVIAIELTQPSLNIYLLPNPDGLQIQSVFHGDVDATLRGSLNDFATLLRSQDKADAMFGKSIEISGDSALANRFQQIIADLKIDWEAMLADLIGDLPAHQVALYASWKAQWYKNSGTSLLLNLEEYLKEEVRLVPTRPEADALYQQIENLQERVERAAARLAAQKN